jgi:hypothetical protein
MQFAHAVAAAAKAHILTKSPQTIVGTYLGGVTVRIRRSEEPGRVIALYLVEVATPAAMPTLFRCEGRHNVQVNLVRRGRSISHAEWSMAWGDPVS